jgi:hypothetical protein
LAIGLDRTTGNTGVEGTCETEFGVEGVETGAQGFFATGDFFDSRPREGSLGEETEVGLGDL